MKRILLATATVLLTGSTVLAAPADPIAPKDTAQVETMTDTTPMQAYADVLDRNLSPGPDGILLFDYAGAKDNDDHKTIKAYIAHLAAQTPSAMSDAEAVSYWANLYNAVTLDIVLDDYPIKSIRSLGPFTSGPWKRDVVTVEGQTLSLDNIEHDIMRVDFASPYIHYMVNCASIGCPNLSNRLWSTETLEADRAAAADAFINSDRGMKLDSRGRIAVSKIYKWFSEDFGDSEDDLRAHLAAHAKGDRLEALTSGARFKGSHYDWDLNEPR